VTGQVKPPRVVGISGSVLINLNGMVGAGIFALPAVLYLNLGNFSPIAILLFALPLACIASIVAKLSTLFERSGGGQLFAETALGKYAGFQMGWLTICANTAGRAANFHVLVSYMAALFPFFEGTIARPVTIVGLIASMTTLSIIGTKRSLGGIWVGTVLKLAPLILLIVLGLGTNGLPIHVQLPEFSGLESVALLIAYAYSGYGMASISAGEAKNPRSTIYRSIFMGLFGVAVFYALVQWAYIAINPDPASADTPLAAAGLSLFGEWGAVAISATAVFSIATNQLNSFVVMPRILFGMGERKLLPRFFAHVSERFLTPDFSILAYALLVFALALSGTFKTLAVLTVAVEQVGLALILISFAVHWRNNFRGMADTIGKRWLIIFPVAVLMLVWMALQVPALAVLSVTGMVAAGTVLYWLFKRRIARELSPVT
jgi:amino acid transporter